MMPQTATRPRPGLTGKGTAAALLVRVQQHWDDFTPAQQAECSAILARLSVALRREHSVLSRIVA